VILSRRAVAAEFIGTGWLVCIVVGSGIMAERLAGGNTAIALLANALATGFGLYVLICLFAPVSGAHFNPLVSLVQALRGKGAWRTAAIYTLAQCAGGIGGTLLAHGMFALPLIQLSTHDRGGLAQGLSELVATAGLLLTILGFERSDVRAVAAAVGLYIACAYWFTASTSFANPAVTLARALTESFSGISPSSVPTFLIGQILGALLGLGLFRLVLEHSQSREA
jgi:glycerol uptake facilitator-like aquaporin